MKIKLLVLFSFAYIFSQAQKKKDLLDEINLLRTKIKDKEIQLIASEEKNKSSLVTVSYLKSQLKEVESQNNDLLKTVTNFTSVSQKKAENMKLSLSQLKKKDKQLKSINDFISSTDSITLTTLKLFKKHIGGLSQVAVKNHTVIATVLDKNLFSSDTENISIHPKGEAFLNKIAQLFSEEPNLSVLIKNNSITKIHDSIQENKNCNLNLIKSSLIKNRLIQKYNVTNNQLYISEVNAKDLDSLNNFTQIDVISNKSQLFDLLKKN